MTPLLAGLFVFAMRVIDMSLDTLRLLFVMRGRKLLAGGIGVIQATVFILAVSAVLKGPLDPLTVAGYALGFGAGVVIGMVVEQRLALGHAMLRVYSTTAGPAIAEALRAASFAVTEFIAHGRDGEITVINSAIARRDIAKAQDTVKQIDPGAFITVDEIQPLQRGYFRH
ncbi:MAG TPA: DUF5698 domain-containing protein [Anaerolineae bacterium]|nr:DUF5698 domain-containing protein [Anaerolineae bacterium]